MATLQAVIEHQDVFAWLLDSVPEARRVLEASLVQRMVAASAIESLCILAGHQDCIDLGRVMFYLDCAIHGGSCEWNLRLYSQPMRLRHAHRAVHEDGEQCKD